MKKPVKSLFWVTLLAAVSFALGGCTDLLVTKKVTYTYRQANESVTIVFFNNEVASKESNLRD